MKRLIVYLGLSIFVMLLIGVAPGLAKQSGAHQTTTKIRKIYFLIHPLIYEAGAKNPVFAKKYKVYIDYEKQVAARWYHAIADMKPDEALVVGAGRCPPKLREFVRSHLGNRGLIITGDLATQPHLWDELSPEAKMGLGHDLLSMYWKYGFEWSSDPLGQPVIARGWAELIKNTFGQRGLSYNPKTVRAEGWGESFEGCVANYGRYLTTYLGLAHPIEDNFEMTVPDAPVLLTAKFLDRVPLKRNVWLYSWKARDGRDVALFLNLKACIGEPMSYAEFHLGTMKIEVISRMGRPMWPKPKGTTQVKPGTPRWEVRRQQKGSTIVEVNGRLKVPIPTPMVLDAAYIYDEGPTSADFRKALTNAEIVQKQ